MNEMDREQYWTRPPRLQARDDGEPMTALELRRLLREMEAVPTGSVPSSAPFLSVVDGAAGTTT